MTISRLDRLLDNLPFKEDMRRIDARLAARLQNDANAPLDVSDFESAEDFAERGIGYGLMQGDTPIGAAYSSLVCSRGIEVSLFVVPEYRRRGVATGLACLLLKRCLENGLEPHWDAANPESCNLARKLGYTPTETYEAHFLKGEAS